MIVARPDWEKKFSIECDASQYAARAVLWQDHEEGRRPVHYWSRKFDSTQKNYPAQERECLALIWALQAFYHYLMGKPFDIYMDHESLRWLKSAKYTRPKLMNWALELQEYPVDNIFHIKGKDNVVSDCLSRIQPDYVINTMAIENETRLEQVKDEELKKLIDMLEGNYKEDNKDYLKINLNSRSFEMFNGCLYMTQSSKSKR